MSDLRWEPLPLAIGLIVGAVVAASIVWYRRSSRGREEAMADLRSRGIELMRLPSRLRRVAADPRTPRQARWWLIGLAVYVASPIDPIPDFIPVLGHLDEVIIVPLVLVKVRRMIPPEVWNDHFPPPSAGEAP